MCVSTFLRYWDDKKMLLGGFSNKNISNVTPENGKKIAVFDSASGKKIYQLKTSFC